MGEVPFMASEVLSNIAHASVQATDKGQILTPQLNVSLHHDRLASHYETLRAVSGSNSHHCFIQITYNKLQIFRQSGVIVSSDTPTQLSVCHLSQYLLPLMLTTYILDNSMLSGLLDASYNARMNTKTCC